MTTSCAPTTCRPRSGGRSRRPHRAGTRADRDAALRAADATPTSCSPGCARPGVLRTPAFADRLEAARAPRGRAHREPRRARCGSRSAGRWRRSTTSRAGLRARRGQGAGRARRRRGRDAAGRALAPDRAGASTPRASWTRASPRRSAARCASWPQLPAELQPGPPSWPRRSTALEVYVGCAAGAGRVTVTKPQSLRARRVRALFCLGLQEGVFPAPAKPEPFLGDDERRAINAASGLRLRLHEDALNVERLFFYAAVSRPTDAARARLARGDRRRRAHGPVAARRRRRRSARAAGWAERRRGASWGPPAGRATPRRPSARPRASPPRPRRPRRRRSSAPLRRPPRSARCASATRGRPRSWRSGRRAR